MRTDYLEILWGWQKEMSPKSDGTFSRSLLSLRLQFETLFEEVGGDRMLKFLDVLSTLSGSEQALILDSFTRVVERVADGETRLSSDKDNALKDFEDNLYKDILNSMKEAVGAPPINKRLEVVDGGKNRTATKKRPIDLAKVREDRKLRTRPILN